MIDLSAESPLSLAQAARRFPPGRRGRPVHPATVYRWIAVGVRTPRGTVRLEGLRLGSRWITSEQAVQRFAEALTPDLDGAGAPPRSPAARRRASERAARQLDQLGI